MLTFVNAAKDKLTKYPLEYCIGLSVRIIIITKFFFELIKNEGQSLL